MWTWRFICWIEVWIMRVPLQNNMRNYTASPTSPTWMRRKGRRSGAFWTSRLSTADWEYPTPSGSPPLSTRATRSVALCPCSHERFTPAWLKTIWLIIGMRCVCVVVWFAVEHFLLICQRAHWFLFMKMFLQSDHLTLVYSICFILYIDVAFKDISVFLFVFHRNFYLHRFLWRLQRLNCPSWINKVLSYMDK